LKTAARVLERHLGVAGVVGAGLIAACCAFYAGAIAPQAERVRELRTAALRLEGERRAGREPRKASAELQLARFQAFFDDHADALAALGTLFADADAAGVRLEAGQYRMDEARGAGLARYVIALPVKGRYPNVQRFVARALHDVPNLALEDISLRRASVADPQIEARLQFALYLGGGR
jgi:hypothetical protein